MSTWINDIDAALMDYPELAFGFLVISAVLFYGLRKKPHKDARWFSPAVVAWAAGCAAWASWLLMVQLATGAGAGGSASSFPLVMVGLITTTVLIYATTVTYNNVKDVRILREQIEENQKKHEETVKRDTAQTRRMLRRLELIEQRINLQSTRADTKNNEERQRFLSLQYIQQLYNDPQGIQSPDDLGLDTLRAREKFRRRLTDTDWNQIDELADHFKDARKPLQEAVRAAAAQVRALRSA